MPSLAIIPTFIRTEGELAVTVRTLETLRDVEPSLETLVVDDCSPHKESLEKLAEECKRLNVRLHLKDENGGFSSTVNVGLREALDRELDGILINADIEFLMPFVEKFEQTQDSHDRPAAVVGALLLYQNGLIQHGGVYICQPPDEMVLTADHGYVPIAQLDPEVHGLVSYSKVDDKIFRAAKRSGRWADDRRPSTGRCAVPGCGSPSACRGLCKPHYWQSHYRDALPEFAGGYPFEVGARPYNGGILALQTSRGTTRVTPEHKLTVFWREETLRSHAVYLMRRGDNWRIGHCAMRHNKTTFGPRMRMLQEDADAAWILQCNLSKDEATRLEALLSWRYRVPTWPFRFARHNRATKGATSQQGLDELWRQVDSTTGAWQALADHGRHLDFPIVQRAAPDQDKRRYPVGLGRRYPIQAGSLIPEAMTVPTDPGSGRQPERVRFTVDVDEYVGDVFSMDVHPHEYYISSNIIVHNSFFNRAFDHKYRYAPAALPEAHQRSICPVTGALFYVRHQTLENVGLFDEQFGLAFEDVDYCLRVFKAGLECIYNPDVRAVHHESLFRGQRSDQIDEWHQKSLSFLHEKHGTTPLGRYVLPLA